VNGSSPLRLSATLKRIDERRTHCLLAWHAPDQGALSLG
jgi:hypothetical protein